MALDAIQFASTPDLTEWLEGRSARTMSPRSTGQRARTELGMWRDVLSAELGRQRWTLTEISALASEHNGTIPFDGVPVGVGFAAGAMLESFHHEPGIYGVDQASMTAKLMDLGPAADAALVDALARWWDGECENTVEGWASVGVTVTE